MFVGGIEAEFRRWFETNKTAFTGRTLFVGCSGNFTIEQILGETAAAVHSNDVSVYTHILGNHLAGQETWVRIKDPAWDWLDPFFTENPGATIVLLFELLKWEQQKNLYQKRIYQEIIDTWEWRFEKTAESVEKAKERSKITSYRSSDIYTFADEAVELDPAGIMLAFLPFYKGGYERLYRRLDEILDWPRPTYEVITPERKREIVAKVQRMDHVVIDDVACEGRRVMLKRNGTKVVSLYSNLLVDNVLVLRHPPSTPCYYPLAKDEDMDRVTARSKVTIMEVKASDINFYRNQFLAKDIDFQSRGSWNWFFFVDEKLFGFMVASQPKFPIRKKGEQPKPDPGMYVNSDFVAPLSKSKRAAKLLLLLLQSTHFKEILQEKLLRIVPNLASTAFTEKPVSMKYRGLWELKKRGQAEDGKKYLNYETKTGLHTDEQALRKWIQSHRR